MILVLETSGSFPSVGIIDVNGNELFYRQYGEKQSHAEVLGTLVADALTSVNGVDGGILAVAINEGPGSYTGLRIGASLAKGLCFTLNVPLLAISGMHGLGKWQLENNSQLQGVWVMIDARRDEVYATYVDRGSMKSNVPQAMILPQEFPNNQSLDCIGFTGDCCEKVRRLLSFDEKSIVLEEFISVRHLYRLAIMSFTSKNYEDVAYFEPFYLKEFQAGISKKFSV
ncbi:MAG: tRNA ((37)-N6)-threonylcarbamoyltransferase complex dimerization subunit type 1 TsaB [Bacteroidota bacterium]|jgi:tRNA threonylcarbamoyladenosine biosynthesis protein TsaB